MFTVSNEYLTLAPPRETIIKTLEKSRFKFVTFVAVSFVTFAYVCNSSKYVSEKYVNPLNANFTKWSNTLKQFVSKLPTNCLSVFNHFVGLVLKGLKNKSIEVDS